MYNLSSMVVTVNQAKIKNKQQHYHSLQTQASLENYNNNNTTIAFTTIISFREHIFRHKAKALRCHHHLTHIFSSRNQIGLICREVWRRWNAAKVVTTEQEETREVTCWQSKCGGEAKRREEANKQEEARRWFLMSTTESARERRNSDNF